LVPDSTFRKRRSLETEMKVISAAKMKFMGKTAGCTLIDHKIRI
jgi:hypothetical protein